MSVPRIGSYKAKYLSFMRVIAVTEVARGHGYYTFIPMTGFESRSGHLYLTFCQRDTSSIFLFDCYAEVLLSTYLLRGLFILFQLLIGHQLALPVWVLQWVIYDIN